VYQRILAFGPILGDGLVLYCVAYRLGMRTQIVRRFLWSASLLIIAWLLALDLYVTQQDSALMYPLMGASLLILVLVAGLAWLFRRAFVRRAEQLRNFTERLLDPDVFDYDLPTGDDELGALGRSLRRTAPRIHALVDGLKVEGARREAILASMVEGVLAVDKDLRVTFCNDSFARMVGARIPVNSGTRLAELVRDPGLLDLMTAVLATSERVERRLSLPAAAGHSFDVLAGPLAGPSTTPGALAIFHDVTELERLERVRKDFVANVSHELRTPLAAIHGYAETLLAGALEDQENKRKFVEVILAQASRLTNIASDLLALSELERARTAPPQQVSVRAALESALRIVETNATSRGVRLIRGTVDDVKIMTHQLRLEQVFVNLLDNAVKFNRPQGEVRVEVQSSGRSACITIGDTGIGIPSEDLPRIFERFYRVDKARSRDMGGTGLGLSIVKHAVEQMGGTVTVDSRLGEGTKFTVMIPGGPN
jgi:two-component system, OmpR family, phosphate regulon sensor histidine kinase PhoR